MKRILAMTLSLVLLVGLTLGGTIAYLTDTDNSVNVMELGNVSIEQLENGLESGGFDHGQPLYPAYYEEGEINWDTAVGVVDKEVTVKNTGKSAAYVRTVFAFEAGNLTNMDDFEKLILTKFADENKLEWLTTGSVEISGEKYFLATYVYPDALLADQITDPSLIALAMNKAGTNEDVAQFGDDYKVLVTTQAVQTENLDSLGSAAAALDEAFGKITATNHPWLNGAGYTVVTNSAELKEAIDGGITMIALAASEDSYVMPSSNAYANKQITITGEGEDTVIEITGKYQTLADAEIVFNNVTIRANGSDECGFAHTKKMTYNNCTIEKQLYLYAYEGETFNNCTFTNTVNNYNVWTYSGNPATFNNCVFNNEYAKAILVYRHGGENVQTTIVNNCSFFAKEAAYTWDGQWVAAIEIDSSLSPCTVEVNNCTTVDTTYNGLLRHKKAGKTPTTITVDGVAVTDSNPVGTTDVLKIGTAETLFAFADAVNNGNSYSGKTIQLSADIDLANAEWTPIGQTGGTTFNGIFDGQNHTISNLKVDSSSQTGGHYSSGLFGWVESHTANQGHIKNVKINGAVITGHHNCGALVGYITEENALVENCHVINATISCTKANDDADGDKAGALIGNATVATPVKNCSASNSTVSAGRDAGQLIGAAKEANVTGCTTDNVTVTHNGDSTGANIANEEIGRKL